MTVSIESSRVAVYWRDRRITECATREEAEAWIARASSPWGRGDYRVVDAGYRSGGQETRMAAKTKKAKGPKSKAGKRQARGQQDLIDHKHPGEAEVLAEAEKLKELETTRMAAETPERDQRKRVEDCMKKHKLEKVEGNGLVITLKHAEDKVSVRKAKSSEDESSGDAED